uniref:protein-L-isoaspartate(D-aspartate) O-methyltransferase n=1 Tax=Tetraselmis sp. GSL018 TaxID=582737 RepID=A0A061S9V0_9CHLO|eukprot:CAMPEP_0177592970 /NCGR_PEP_ID=MMETSP0419_2-20121207/8857_1 /TAXON_ID=582737 /ORGANISM="Tetraselmis sp., Strain GSL018" /LENGTH=543 /DNA_ID=CAMNT_0019083899 /DNA_START=156 /DNA_END=1787 /DNA_ORIENTATION=-
MDPNDEHVAPAHRIELDTASEDHDSGDEQDGISSEEDQAAEEGRPVDRGDLEGGEAPEIEPQRPEHLEPGDLRGWMRFRHARAIERLNSEQILHAMLGIHVARDNAELVEHLRDTSSLRSEEVAAAFQACPRGSFVPSEYSAQAYVETPIRIEALGFNISAPHMHAMCLERLDLRPGLRVLDVGCGCGAVTAMCAFLVGKTGAVTGVDILPKAVELSRANLANLASSSDEYHQRACDCSILEHNVFLPRATAERYDRIHVGAQCPEEKVPNLLRLLGEEGGVVIVPVDSELRAITKHTDGRLTTEALAQVRFGDIVVPSDAKLVLETLKMQRAAECEVPSVCASASAAAPSGEHTGSDCFLVGDGWRVPSRKSLLRECSQHFQARFDSGMRDADADELHVPEHIRRETIEAFQHFAQHGEIPCGLSAEEVSELAQAAVFFNSQALSLLCEDNLVRKLRSCAKGAEELAVRLLILSDEIGLAHLRNVVLDWIVDNYAAVSNSYDFKILSGRQVSLVAERACCLYSRAVSLLEESVDGHMHDKEV